MSKLFVRIAMVCLVFGVALSGVAKAEDFNGMRIYSVDAEFDDAKFNLENAIVDRGLAIAYSGKIGEMLARTAGEVEGSMPVFKHADFFLFCSAKITGGLAQSDPRNLGFCPFIVFVYETLAEPGKSYVGYRRPTIGGSDASKKAQVALDELLDGIVKEAAE